MNDSIFLMKICTDLYDFKYLYGESLHNVVASVLDYDSK